MGLIHTCEPSPGTCLAWGHCPCVLAGCVLCLYPSSRGGRLAPEAWTDGGRPSALTSILVWGQPRFVQLAFPSGALCQFSRLISYSKFAQVRSALHRQRSGHGGSGADVAGGGVQRESLPAPMSGPVLRGAGPGPELDQAEARPATSRSCKPGSTGHGWAQSLLLLSAALVLRAEGGLGQKLHLAPRSEALRSLGAGCVPGPRAQGSLFSAPEEASNRKASLASCRPEGWVLGASLVVLAGVTRGQATWWRQRKWGARR